MKVSRVLGLFRPTEVKQGGLNLAKKEPQESQLFHPWSFGVLGLAQEAQVLKPMCSAATRSPCEAKLCDVA